MVEPITTTVAVVKGVCYVCSLLGIGYCSKKAYDAYSKSQETKQKRLNMKSKAAEKAAEDNKKIQDEINSYQKKQEENEQKIRDLEKKAEDAKNKSKDTNFTEEERIAWRNKAKQFEDQSNELRRTNNNIFDSIKKLRERMQNNDRIISSASSDTDDIHWIWSFLTLENIVIMGAVYALYRILREDKRKD